MPICLVIPQILIALVRSILINWITFNEKYKNIFFTDTHSDKDFIEAEETILYHLANRTESQITENEIVTVFKGLAATPQFILTPFLISAILIMCNMNRYPASATLASSQILPFLRNVIRNNEDEKEMCKESAWCRDTSDMNPVDFNKVLSVLIEQNRDGGDVVTPGN